MGGNADNIALLEKQTGLKVGERLNYAYLPTGPLQWPGSDGRGRGPWLQGGLEGVAPLEDLGLQVTYGGIAGLELEYISRVLASAPRWRRRSS